MFPPSLSYAHSSPFSAFPGTTLCLALRMLRGAEHPPLKEFAKQWEEQALYSLSQNRLGCLLILLTIKKQSWAYNSMTPSRIDAIKDIWLYFREALIPSTLYLPALLVMVLILSRFNGKMTDLRGKIRNRREQEYQTGSSLETHSMIYHYWSSDIVESRIF